MRNRLANYAPYTLALLLPTLARAALFPTLQVQNQTPARIDILRVCLEDGTSCFTPNLDLGPAARSTLTAPSGFREKLELTIFSRRFGCSKQVLTISMSDQSSDHITPIVQDTFNARRITKSACQGS